jgi:hypothetical protein
MKGIDSKWDELNVRYNVWFASRNTSHDIFYLNSIKAGCHQNIALV